MSTRRVATYGDNDGLLPELLGLIEGATERAWIKAPWWDTSPEPSLA